MDGPKAIYGVMAEFATADSLVEAARRVHAEGYRRTDAYSPFPIHELFDALDAHDRRVPFFILCGGIAGALAGFGLCYCVVCYACSMLLNLLLNS